jgi:hypothetical protein
MLGAATGTLHIVRMGLRRAVSLAAIYAVALQTIALGIAPMASGAGGSVAGDPFSVICHSDAQTVAPAEQTPDTPDIIPGHACDYCNLCTAAAPPPTRDLALFGRLLPARVLHGLRPLSTTVRTGTTSDPKLARGPPYSA